MRAMKWFAAASCLSVLAISGSAWAGTNDSSTFPAAQSGQNVSADKIFSRKPFTADMVVNAGKDRNFHGKMYAGNHALRMQMEVRPGVESTTIVRYDKKVIWVLMTDQKRYMEMPMNPRAGMMATLRDQDTKYEIKDLGAEKVGQYACEKYEIHWSRNGHESNGLVWVASSGGVKGMIVRAQDEKTGATTEYSNIQPGEPAASLFEVPAGYQKFDMPGMGGMSGIPQR